MSNLPMQQASKPWYKDAGSVARLACCCILLFTLSAPLLVPPILFGKMAADLHASQAHVASLVPAFFGLGCLLSSFPASLFMERFGVHCSFILGMLAQCVLITVQVASTCIWQFVAVHFLLGACSGLACNTAFIAFCNVWFGKQPSTTIAIIFSAFGVAGSVWSTGAAYIATNFGWRAALAVAAAAQWCVALPLAIFAMRDPPASASQRDPSPVARRPSLNEDDFPMWWISDSSVWLLVLLIFCVLYVTVSISNSVTLFFHDETGISLQQASWFTGLIFACNFIVKLASGPLYDSRHASKFAVIGCVLLLVACALLYYLSHKPSAGPTAIAFAVTFGVGYGMSFSLCQSKAALHFGHRCGFKALQGFLNCWQMVGMILGGLVTPELAQAASYSDSFLLTLIVAVMAVAAVVGFEARERSLRVHSASMPFTLAVGLIS